MIITPFPKQREAYRIASNKTITVFGGAIRGGKTYWLLLSIFSYAINYPNSRWIILRSSEDNVLNNLMPSFRSVLSLGFDSYLVSFVNRTAKLKNGSEIRLMQESYNNDKELNKFRGLEINGCAIDELNEIQQTTFDKIIERSGSWQQSKGCPIKILATTNPSQGWVKKRIYDNYINGTIANNIAYIPSNLYDNPIVSQNKEYVESLKSLPPYQYKTFVEGNWDAFGDKDGTEFYKFFDIDKHCNSTIKYDKELPLHLSFDFNVLPYVSILITQVIDKQIFIIDEICATPPNNSTQLACRLFKQRYANHTAGVFLYGDPSGKKEDTRSEKGTNDFTLIMSELKQYNVIYRVESKAPSLVARCSFINNILRINEYNIYIAICSHCVNTIADFSYVKQKPDGTKSKERISDSTKGVSYEKYGHLSDCFDYFICSCFSHDFHNSKVGNNNNEIKIYYDQDAQKDVW